MSSMEGIIEPIFGGPEGSTNCLFKNKQKTATKNAMLLVGKRKRATQKKCACYVVESGTS